MGENCCSTLNTVEKSVQIQFNCIPEVLELARAEDRIEVVAEQVAAEAYDFEGVLHAVEEPLRQTPDLKTRGRDSKDIFGMSPSLSLIMFGVGRHV